MITHEGKIAGIGWRPRTRINTQFDIIVNTRISIKGGSILKSLFWRLVHTNRYILNTKKMQPVMKPIATTVKGSA